MIVVECSPDEFLVKSMGFGRKMIKHESGKGKVLEKVRKNEKLGKWLVGITEPFTGTANPDPEVLVELMGRINEQIYKQGE